MSEANSQEGAERRKHERHAINLAKTLEIDGVPTPLMDISWGGISFYAQQTYAEGTVISFQEGALNVDAKVLGVHGSKGEPAHPDYPFCVRCQFVEAPDHPNIEAVMEFALNEEGIGF